MPQGALWGLALLCAALMGLAMQRGATCLVVAVDEWLRTRKTWRAAALGEAALWAATGLLLLQAAGHPAPVSAGHAVTAWTLAGAVVLGLGAVLNGACAVGAVARLGSGQWAYAATPVGFYLGCRVAEASHVVPLHQALAGPPLLASAPAVLAWVLLLLLCLRSAWVLRHARQAFSPNTATACIGILFAVLVGLAGAWAYTDLLSGLVRRMATPGLVTEAMQWALAAALLAGALAGGLMAGTWRWPQRWPWRQTLRCLAGGALLGLGSLWVPGSNDGLLLLGLPLLWPHAWAAMAVMVATIAVVLKVQRHLHSERHDAPAA